MELHYEEMHVEQSILIKLVAARCINTALLIYFVAQDSGGDLFSLNNLEKIQSVLLADCIATPMFRICNIPDMINRYILGFFSVDQDELNTLWRGAEWTLAERYTDVLKSIFTGLFFLVPLPSGLFITACSMITTYIVDKYSLYRLWKRKPAISGNLSVIVRLVIAGAIWAHIFVSLRFFAQWPYGGLWGDVNNDLTKCTYFSCEHHE